MQDEQLPASQDNQENKKPALRTISKKLSRKHKRFCDAYLLTLNATQAYKEVFKPKCPEYAYKNAYKVLRIEGVARYIEEALNEASDSDYRPEAIKQGIRALALTATRDADKLRALELMSRISGLLTDQSQTQVNVFTDDIMSLAKKRLSERKELAKSQTVILPESSEVIDTKEDTDPMSYNNPYVPNLSESVLSINTDKEAGLADATDGSARGAVGNEGVPGVDGYSTPHPPVEVDINPRPIA